MTEAGQHGVPALAPTSLMNFGGLIFTFAPAVGGLSDDEEGQAKLTATARLRERGRDMAG